MTVKNDLWIVLRFFLVCIWFVQNTVTISGDGKDFAATSLSVLKKKDHFVVTASEFPVSVSIQRNASGHLVRVTGVSPLILDWLSICYKFSYSILDTKATTIEDKGPNVRGHASYAIRGECDIIMAAIMPSSERLQVLDFIHPWLYTSAAFLVPLPDILGNNVDAITKPFQLWVWVSLAVAAISVVFILSCFNQFLKKRSHNVYEEKIMEKQNQQQLKNTAIISNISMYVLGSLLNQGGNMPSRILMIQFVVGSWLLLALVLVNIYNGTLISYLTITRRDKPLINSPEDIVANANLHLVVNKGLASDLLLSIAKTGINKMLGDKLRAYSRSRCDRTHECIDLVKSLPPRHIYTNGKIAVLDAIKEDFLKTGKCELTMVAEGSSSLGFGWALAKNSPYLEEFNRGMLMIFEVGLIHRWEKQFEPDTKPCLNNEIKFSRKANEPKPLLQLRLINLTGAFALLIMGLLISIMSFFIENTTPWNRCV